MAAGKIVGVAIGLAFAMGFQALVMSPGTAPACGTICDWISKYQQARSNTYRRSALRELQVACGDYAGKRDDRPILEVLSDAARHNVDNDLIQRVFDTYRCVPTAWPDRRPGNFPAAGSKALAVVLDFSKCPNEADLANWHEVIVDAAIVRADPSIKATRIGWLHRGAVVVGLKSAGDWMEIRSLSGLTGYVHNSLLGPY